MLDHSPEAFAQEVRARCRSAADRFSVVVVEGFTDRIALLPFLDPATQVIAANGKDKLLCAYSSVEVYLRNRLIFVLDCDGTTDPDLKGRPDLILTHNRDLDADLIYELEGWTRLAHEFLGASSADRNTAESRMHDILSASSKLSSCIGALTFAAHGRGWRTRVKTRGKSEPLSPRHIPSLLVDLFSPLRDIGSLALQAADLLEWPSDDVQSLVDDALLDMETACGMHAKKQCWPCLNRRRANGHATVDAISMSITRAVGIAVEPVDVSRVLRASTVRNEDWSVVRRLRMWEAMTGELVLSGIA